MIVKLAEKIRFMRLFKGWTQEETAAKLHMVISGYAKIEHGQTDVPFSRLQQIAKLFEIEVTDLIGLNEKNVFNVIAGQDAHANNPHHSTVNVYSCEAAKFQHENEKLQLMIEQKDQELSQKNREIDLLQQQVDVLRTMVGLLKTPLSSQQ
jgi:transcriptional regulator with XRE-family HTH domain